MAATMQLPPPTYSPLPFFTPNEGGAFFPPTSTASNLERSIRRVMSRYGAGDLDGTALLPSYRCLRRRRPQEENQAVAVTSDETSYKITLDVRDFAEGSVNVRAVGENELVVEGTIERKEESSPSANFTSSKSCSKKFQQRFMFPGLQVSGVSSTVSSDGIMTITAPRKASEDKSVEYKLPVSSLTDQQQQQQLGSKMQTTEVKETSIATEGALKSDNNEHIVPIEVEGKLVINQKGDVSDNYTSQNMKATQEKISQESNIQSQQTQTSAANRSDLTNTSVMNIPVTSSDFMTRNLSDMCRDLTVPVHSKGLFFQDSFFENSRRHFEDAVSDVKRRVDRNSSVSDPLSWYNSHRTTNLLEDTRAGTIKTEDTSYKIILDVKDFEGGSVNVKAVGDSEILVEGTLEQKTEGSSVSRRFTRRFIMPGLVKCEAITSALSADGVLTVTAPKMQSNFKLIELSGDNANMTSNSITNSSIFGTSTCNTPNISMPPSSVTSPTTEEPFSPVFSRIQEENEAVQQQQQQSANMSEKQRTTSSTTTETNVQSSIDKVLHESSRLVDAQREHLVPIGLEENKQHTSTNNEKIVNIDYVNKTQSEIDAQKRIENLKNESNHQYQLIGTVKDLSDTNLKETVKQRKTSSSQSTGNREIAIRYDDPSSFVFPIVRRGPFYQDSFFNEVQPNFRSAIRQVLDRWVDVPSLLSSNRNTTSSLCNFDRFNSTLSNYRSILDCDFFDDLTCYKNLRHRSLNEESQASTVKENEQDFKIVLDVHGFSEKDLSIRATSQRELTVEGKVESQSGGAKSSHQFKRQFILPGPVRMEAVYSALSADDILTITVPKNTALKITQ